MKISIAKWVNAIGMPLVTTDDRRLCFLIDTGASYSVLLREAYDRCTDIFHPMGKDDYLLGMIGDAQHIFMVDGTITLDNLQYTDEFGVLASSDAMTNVRILTGTRIDGALGVSFLRKYGINIDFNCLSLSTPDNMKETLQSSLAIDAAKNT